MEQGPDPAPVAALAVGIVLQWYVQLSLIVLLVVAGLPIFALASFSFLSITKQFTFRSFQGLLLNLLIVASGALLVYVKDIRNNRAWFGKHYYPKQLVLATLQEPVVEKPNSYKALATVNAVGKDKAWKETNGKVILYIQKTEAFKALHSDSK